ncbi:SET and MYND domain-containing protein 5 [Seminavis robusta]|uniref:SET and MYND domain-containing protein 5 n=1 Tax=Seminavis robusta TaxID=568900 RepID=A0A9N8HWI1_9STRA|nr:SET and MYND domain-containing protein 5 [Seminavis robusta]|eukprot:Sro2220_g319620.1 SET and MYND domain-containing protein 5 (425) ;mRNA; f:11470-12869
MARAYVVTEGRIEAPPVVVVDFGVDRGRGLVASWGIAKGEVIFTEKALVGAQVPDGCPSSSTSRCTGYKVRACQQCFRSLEPGSCLVPNGHDSTPTTTCSSIPLPHLWPVMEYSSDKTVSLEDHLVEDTISRQVTCTNCHIWFCTRWCAKSYQETTGNCCQSTQAVASAIKALACGDGDDDDNQDGRHIDPVYALTTRMFAMQQQQSTNGQSLFDDLCGDANDITALQLGDYCPHTYTFSLAKGYDPVCQALALQERSSLEEFHRLAAVAQRNGILVTTKSPFREYYGAVLRNTGGRGSTRQQQVVSEIAQILGAPDGKLTREMDDIVEEKCAVKMAGLFTLTAIMNHSCDPNAEIRGSEYNDCHIDIAAKKRIEKGDEITISYLDLGPGDAATSNSTIARNRRRRHLGSKYLFVCQCARCSSK